MYFLRYAITPAPDHLKVDRIGEGIVCCWVEQPTLRQADRVARARIAGEKWQVLHREEARLVREGDYERADRFLGLFREALILGEVYEYHTAPRFPVYWVNVTVELGGDTAEAHYFVCNELIREKGDDVYDPAFWEGPREDAAFGAAVAAIEEAGWTLTEAPEGRPVGRGDVPEDFLPFYDEAEGPTPVLVFLRQGENG